MVQRAIEALDPETGSLLFIENVGNLVCPALFDIGEQAKVVIISVTEGHDKPLKYPHMFAAADLVIVNKTDLLPYVDFDLERFSGYARRLNPDVEILPLSARIRRPGRGLVRLARTGRRTASARSGQSDLNAVPISDAEVRSLRTLTRPSQMLRQGELRKWTDGRPQQRGSRRSRSGKGGTDAHGRRCQGRGNPHPCAVDQRRTQLRRRLSGPDRGDPAQHRGDRPRCPSRAAADRRALAA